MFNDQALMVLKFLPFSGETQRPSYHPDTFFLPHQGPAWCGNAGTSDLTRDGSELCTFSQAQKKARATPDVLKLPLNSEKVLYTGIRQAMAIKDSGTQNVKSHRGSDHERNVCLLLWVPIFNELQQSRGLAAKPNPVLPMSP